MAAPSPPLATLLFSAEQHANMTPYMAALHAGCITSDRVGPFLPPLTHEKLLAWWKVKIKQAEAGSRIIFLLLPQPPEGTKPQGSDLRGLGMLELVETESGSYRAQVDKLLVKSSYRRQGGAGLLMRALEREATKRGRTLLLAEAETGSAGEEAFKRLGYTEFGRVPAYRHVPPSGKTDETFFYKQLE